MTDRYERAVARLEFAAANAMRTCRCAAARRAVRAALAELRTARLVARETQSASAAGEPQPDLPRPVPEPPAGHPAALNGLTSGVQLDDPAPARPGYLGAHKSLPPGDE